MPVKESRRVSLQEEVYKWHDDTIYGEHDCREESSVSQAEQLNESVSAAKVKFEAQLEAIKKKRVQEVGIKISEIREMMRMGMQKEQLNPKLKKYHGFWERRKLSLIHRKLNSKRERGRESR